MNDEEMVRIAKERVQERIRRRFTRKGRDGQLIRLPKVRGEGKMVAVPAVLVANW